MRLSLFVVENRISEIGVIEYCASGNLSILFSSGHHKTFFFPNCIGDGILPYDHKDRENIGLYIETLDKYFNSEAADRDRLLSFVEYNFILENIDRDKLKSCEIQVKHGLGNGIEEIRRMQGEIRRIKAKEEAERQIKLTINKLTNDYGFEGLWHFTDYTNLQSIFKQGYIYGRLDCQRSGIHFKDGADQDVISKTAEGVKECVRLYFRNQTPTLYDNEGIKKQEQIIRNLDNAADVVDKKMHIPRPVYFLFSKELLLKNCVFTDGNAASSQTNHDSSATFFSNIDWKTVFHKGSFFPEERDYIINKRQAEVLLSKPLLIDSAIKIFFRNNADFKQAEKEWPEYSCKFGVRNECFSDKDSLPKSHKYYNNYIEDYELYESTSKAEKVVMLTLKRPLHEYKIDVKLVNVRSQEELPIGSRELKNSKNDFVKDESEATKMLYKWFSDGNEKCIVDVYLNGIQCIHDGYIERKLL